MSNKAKVILNPLRSPVAALLLAVFLGPIGLIYTSILGAIILLFLLLVAFGAHSMYALSLIWLLSCFWAVIAANRYNRRIMKKMGVMSCAESIVQDL